MSLALLLDVGSTFTKVAAVELGTGNLISWTMSPTTRLGDVLEGVEAAIAVAESRGGFCRRDAEIRLASSSAAGGLKMAVVGLVPELTVEAAARAALGAGARLTHSICYEMTPQEAADLRQAPPDIILLVGGTDGGNRSTVLHNAAVLADLGPAVPYIVAANKTASPVAADRLAAGGHRVWTCPNVLPAVDSLNVDPVREIIREVFMQHIVAARGLDRLDKHLDGVIMPTPVAVMEAAELLAGDSDCGGAAAMVVDVGGATTDVYSVGAAESYTHGAVYRGLAEPDSKRTVEGDLGVRIGAGGVLAQVGGGTLARMLSSLDSRLDVPEAAVATAVERMVTQPALVPRRGEWQEALDGALAWYALRLAMARHVGRTRLVYTPTGPVLVLEGKDLRGAELVVGTGGPLVFGRWAQEVLQGVLFDPEEPDVLKPAAARLMVDSNYIMFAAGLLRQADPYGALNLIRNSLLPVKGRG